MPQLLSVATRAGRRRRGRRAARQARGEHLRRRARDLLGERHRLGGAVEHVAGDRALGKHEQLGPAAAASSRRARQASRFRSFSPSFGSICATATRMERRLYYPSRADGEGAFLLRRRLPVLVHGVSRGRGGGGRRRGRGRVAAVRAAGPRRSRCSRSRGDHLRVDWTQNVYRRALALGIEIHLPRYQPRSTLTLAACLWAGGEGRLRDFKHALYEAFFCEGEDIATDARDRARGGARRSRPGGGGRRRLLAGAASRASARSGPRRRRRASAASRRSSRAAASTHWGMGGVERLLAGQPLVPRA